MLTDQMRTLPEALPVESITAISEALGAGAREKESALTWLYAGINDRKQAHKEADFFPTRANCVLALLNRVESTPLQCMIHSLA